MYNQKESKILVKSSSSHRADLTTENRFKIACIALFFCVYGTVTNLSQKYNISRQFVYDLKKELDLLCKLYIKYYLFILADTQKTSKNKR